MDRDIDPVRASKKQAKSEPEEVRRRNLRRNYQRDEQQRHREDWCKYRPLAGREHERRCATNNERDNPTDCRPVSYKGKQITLIFSIRHGYQSPLR